MTGAVSSILVLGPHRSGTSAVTRVLNLLGVDLGSDLLPPREDNRHGFWEHREVFELHERLLTRLGLAWHDYLPLPDGWRDLDGVESARRELRDLLRREFADADLWAVKDPRLSRLLPLWLEVLEDLGSQAGFVFVVRNPLEVVDSLQRRHRFPFETCLLLYAAETVAALRHTRGRRRAFVSFAQLLDDWRQATAGLDSALGVRWPRPVAEPEAEIDAFLRPGERHHRHSEDDLRSHDAVPAWCAGLYAALEAACRGDDEKLETATRRADDAFTATVALVAPDLEHLRAEVARLEQRAERAQRNLETVQGHLTSILSSRLYRSTRLPRRLLHRLGRLR